jgi:hypothetical protein
MKTARHFEADPILTGFTRLTYLSPVDALILGIVSNRATRNARPVEKVSAWHASITNSGRRALFASAAAWLAHPISSIRVLEGPKRAWIFAHSIMKVEIWSAGVTRGI